MGALLSENIERIFIFFLFFIYIKKIFRNIYINVLLILQFEPLSFEPSNTCQLNYKTLGIYKRFNGWESKHNIYKCFFLFFYFILLLFFFYKLQMLLG